MTQSQKLADLVATSQAVAATRSRKEKIALLSAYLSALSSEDVALASMYLAGEVRQGKVGLGWAAISGAGAADAGAATGRTLAEVDTFLTEIASVRGPGSASARKRLLDGLFAGGTAAEREFLGALLLGGIRQGALASILMEALARAQGSSAREVSRAVMMAPSLGEVARALWARGRAGLDVFGIRPFHFVQPMLAQLGQDVQSVLAQGGESVFEYKLDGARIQVHRDGDEVRIFSRGGNDVTRALPEVVSLAHRLPPRSFILDGEAIALRDNGRPHPFQVTMRRFGRDLADIAAIDALPLSAFLFDILYLDGETVIDRALRDRLPALDIAVPEESRVRRAVLEDADAARAFVSGAFAAGHEGAMAKAPDAPYEAGRRGGAWLKLKKVHTLDLVVLAVEWGSGRRRGWLSNVHLGARGDGDDFIMLGKTFKGMTDEVLAWQTKEFQARQVDREGHIVHVRPEIVGEFAFSDVMVSPQYPAGLSLRLARLIRYRPDKSARDAATIQDVRAIAIADGVLSDPVSKV